MVSARLFAWQGKYRPRQLISSNRNHIYLKMKKRIKLLQITQTEEPGGVPKYLIQLAKNLNREKFEVVGCFSNPHSKGKEFFLAVAFNRLKVPSFYLKMSRNIDPPHDLQALLRLYKLMKREHFDLVHAHSSKAGVIARIAARMAGVPVIIYSPHAFFFAGQTNLLKKHLFLFLEKIAGCFCDLIITDSLSERDLAVKEKIGRQEKIIALNNSIDINDYSFPLDKDKKIASLEIKRGSQVVTMVSRLVAQKSPFDFIKMAKTVLEKFPDAVFLIVGDGPLKKECENLIKRMDITKEITVLGWRDDVKEILKISDVSVLCSRWEGLPFSLLESMALEIPVVATASTGSVDVICDGINGILVPKGDPEAIARAVMKILENKEFAENLGKNGKKTVEKDFSLSAMIQSLESIYLDLFENKKILPLRKNQEER